MGRTDMGFLEFKGKWRTYQERVLKNADRYLADGKIHIVAAPGSGKTTLGIELIRRLGERTLILTPSVTIKEQWAARITEAFLCEGAEKEKYLSLSLKEPKTITIVTYQALHAAMTGEKEGDVQNEFGAFCLDECHHLRSEWWKALEGFKKKCSNPKIIALTATPPYDSTPVMWKRYLDMCGEIDEEITIPELVKEGSLCPHQDFVYFNYPTEEETAEIRKFEERSRRVTERLLQDEAFFQAIKSHIVFTGVKPEETLLKEREYLEAFLTYLNEKKAPLPSVLKKTAGTKLPSDMTAEKMECLLQGFLYDDTEAYACELEFPEKLKADLKSEGLIERKKVMLAANGAVEKLLVSSKGKANSIRDIVLHEYAAAGDRLRLLLLTDYIRAEYEKAVGDTEGEINALGVLPFFELLRRAASAQNQNRLRLGILCGTIVVIPTEAKEALLSVTKGVGNVTFEGFGASGTKEYLKVCASGGGNFLTKAVTNLFAQGRIQVLIGTKSLLGEGWDSPCVNSLILASFVGSFMLSNQMRGRAIRVWKENPEKTSNIWHLVCLKPDNEENQKEGGGDFALLERRMEHFLGLHYTENKIENGMARLTFIKSPFNKENTDNINKKMLALSDQREQLKERWEKALTIHNKMEIIENTDVENEAVSDELYQTAKKKTTAAIAAAALSTGMTAAAAAAGAGALFGLFGLFAAGSAVVLFRNGIRAAKTGTPVKRLRLCGMGIREAMRRKNLLEKNDSFVAAEVFKTDLSSVSLMGAGSREKALFSQCVREFFAEIDDQRYLLVKRRNRKAENGFYCVPACFAGKKEDAELFAACMTPYIGDYELVYTRNEKGRELLLKGRIAAMAEGKGKSSSRRTVC